MKAGVNPATLSVDFLTKPQLEYIEPKRVKYISYNSDLLMLTFYTGQSKTSNWTSTREVVGYAFTSTTEPTWEFRAQIHSW